LRFVEQTSSNSLQLKSVDRLLKPLLSGSW
jgi:hypothetical protein